MHTVQGAARPSGRMVLMAALGGGLEYYDFVIYGIFAQQIAAAFFPASDPLASLTLSLAVFAVGYLARPFGGMLLSHFGDRHGRRQAFVVTIFTMSACTLAISILPAHAEWGAAAGITLLLLRFVQGLCIGGELPGAVTYVVESARHRPGLACGIVFALVNAGVLLAAMVKLLLVSWLSAAAFADMGWRIAFAVGGLLGLISFWLRRDLQETPIFENIRHEASQNPVGETLSRHWRKVLLGCAVAAPTAAFNGLLFAHMPPYLEKLAGYDASDVAIAMNLALAAMSAFLILVAWWADHIPPRRLLRISSLMLLLGVPAGYSLLAGGAAPLNIVLPAFALAAAGANGSFAFLLARLFPSRIRFSGVALSLNISFTLFSGLGPLAANALIGASGWNASPGIVIAAAALIGLAASFAGALRTATRD